MNPHWQYGLYKLLGCFLNDKMEQKGTRFIHKRRL